MSINSKTTIDQLEAYREALALRAEIFPDAVAARDAVAEVIRLRRRLGHGIAADIRRITLCGSQRFSYAFAFWHTRLMLAEGAMVHTAPVIERPLTAAEKDRIDILWFAQIETSDQVFVIDTDMVFIDEEPKAVRGESYVGASTGEEIAFANEQGIPVRFLSTELAPAEEESDPSAGADGKGAQADG